MARNQYVLMFKQDGKDMFATTTIKRRAIQRAKKVHATVYAVPNTGLAWDCPTIRVIFRPIFQG